MVVLKSRLEAPQLTHLYAIESSRIHHPPHFMTFEHGINLELQILIVLNSFDQFEMFLLKGEIRV